MSIFKVILLDIDECRSAMENCDSNNGICTNTVGSFTCSCDVGYTGDGITCSSKSIGHFLTFELQWNNECTDIDECREDMHNCHENANCIDTVGSFSCSCNSGYFGDGISCEGICDEFLNGAQLQSYSLLRC